MPIEVNTDRAICNKCGTAFGRRKGNFPVSYAQTHKGTGYTPICKTCIDTMYNTYLSQCKNAKDAVRQMCRKLDLYWNESVYNSVEKKNTTRSMMTQYIARISSITYAGKSYDDTLAGEGTLWSFGKIETAPVVDIETADDNPKTDTSENEYDIPEEVIAFWGPGNTPAMYAELEQRRKYWMSKLPEGYELDIGTEALIRQICSTEIDINRDRAAGRSVDKNVKVLEGLLGSANLKPGQKKQDEMDSTLSSTPLGVWLYRYENKRPLPEIDDDLKDVNGLRRYVFTWMGHLCKMLGLKNAYSRMYEDEIARLRVDKPEYDGDDDESFFEEIMLDEPPGYESGEDST